MTVKIDPDAPRSWLKAMARGSAHRCPQCGEGQLFARYIRTRDVCAVCDLDLTGHRADDAPPYLTIMIVGHLAIPLALASKQLFDPPLALQFAVWLPIMIVASALLLPVTKGAMVGLQWAHRMHGFEAHDGAGDDVPTFPDYTPNY